jgi:hypothetical protein
MTIETVASLLQDLGGYGIAALMWWFWRQERDERIRYRDLQEMTLRDIPEMTNALRGLTNEVSRINQGPTFPSAE